MKLTYIIIYFCIIAFLSVAITIIDKSKAKNGKYRVPERTLMILAALGGALPMYITMKIIRHKTLHKKFMIGLPIIFVIQIIIIILCFKTYS